MEKNRATVSEIAARRVAAAPGESSDGAAAVGAWLDEDGPERADGGSEVGPSDAAQRRGAAAVKRGMDIVLASLLLIVLAPVFLTIAVAIKLDSRGPIVFRQRRIGRWGEGFDMLKFRTMVDGADGRKHEVEHLNDAAEGLFKIHQDPRVTRFGAFLRSTSLDELPQLIHVLTGRMSLVGPRPLIPEEDRRIEGDYRRRLEMRPGMTGVWQVAGASRIPISEMVKLDHKYVATWSQRGDLKLLLGTGQHVLRRRGI